MNTHCDSMVNEYLSIFLRARFPILFLKSCHLNKFVLGINLPEELCLHWHSLDRGLSLVLESCSFFLISLHSTSMLALG